MGDPIPTEMERKRLLSPIAITTNKPKDKREGSQDSQKLSFISLIQAMMCCCCIYKDAVLHTAQALSLFAFFCSLSLITFVPATISVVLLQAAWCCRVNKDGFIALGAFTLVAAGLNGIYAGMVLDDPDYDCDYRQPHDPHKSAFCPSPTGLAVYLLVGAGVWVVTSILVVFFVASGRFDKCRADSENRSSAPTSWICSWVSNEPPPELIGPSSWKFLLSCNPVAFALGFLTAVFQGIILWSFMKYTEEVFFQADCDNGGNLVCEEWEFTRVTQTIVFMVLFWWTLPDTMTGLHFNASFFFSSFVGRQSFGFRLRVLLLGLVALGLGIATLVLSYKHINAVATSDSQALLATVGILFVMDIDEAIFKGISKSAPHWHTKIIREICREFSSGLSPEEAGNTTRPHSEACLAPEESTQSSHCFKNEEDGSSSSRGNTGAEGVAPLAAEPDSVPDT